MSKIPIANGGFRSYVSKNNEKPTKSAPDESRKADNLDRIGDKENMSRDGKKSNSSFSLKNPVPTEEDYARYDADRRFRETARDVRVAQRSAENTARSSMSPLRTTPERLSGGSSDQFYTPGRSTSGGPEQFVTPETSKKEMRSSDRRFSSRGSTSAEGTPTARTRDFTERDVYSNNLMRRMEHNFGLMNQLIRDGRPPREARHEALLLEIEERSPRRAQRRTAEQMRATILATRSSSQPPSYENIARPRAPKTKSPDLEANVAPVAHTSYVDAVISAHRAQIHYADVTSVDIERQYTKLESLKFLQNLADLSKSKEFIVPKKRRVEAGSDTSEFSEWVKESDEITAKKWAKLQEIKLRLHQIRQVKEATHNLLTTDEPFEEDEDDERILNSTGHWMSVPFRVFDRRTAQLLANLSVKMKTTMKDYKQVSTMMNKKYLNRSANSRRSSKVYLPPPRNPIELSKEDEQKVNDYSKLPPPPPTRLVYPNHRDTRDVASQVTGRLSIDPMTSWVPRPLTIEKLELRGIKCPYSPASADKSTETAESPKTVESEVSEHQEVVEAVEAQTVIPPLDLPVAEEAPAPAEPNLLPPESGFQGTPRPPGLPITVDDLNRMLSGIVLQRDVPFKSEVGFPKNPYSPEESYRSGRSSLDPDSARRLSSGIAHYLKKFIQEQEGHEEESSSTTSGEKIVVTLQSPSDKSSSVGWSLADMEYNVYQNELNVHEETQWEHEKEEEELRHLREVGAETPTREIKEEMEERPAAPEPHTPREDDLSEEVVTPDVEKEEDTTLTEDKEEEDVPEEQENEEPMIDVEKDDDEKTVTGELDESEGDEMKKFYVQDEFENAFEENVREPVTPVQKQDVVKESEMPTDPPSYEETMNETADDSGFLLDDRPVPRLKSIFDQVSPPSSDAPAPPAPSDNVHLRSDTPRLPAEDPLPLGDITNDSTFKELDLEDYCQKEFLFDIGPIMIQNVIQLQEQLRGVDWIEAQAIWQPPTFTDLNMDYYDHFDYFDSFAMLLWSGVVELFNEKYAKFGRKMTAAEEKTFKEEVWEMLKSDYGVESKKREWSMDVPLSARLQGRMPFDLEYRFDMRRNLPKEEKQVYKWQQFQMKTIAARYPRKELEESLNETYVEQKAILARFVLTREVAAYFREKEEEEAHLAEARVEEEEVRVDDGEVRGEEVSSEEASVAAAGAEEDAVGESDV